MNALSSNCSKAAPFAPKNQQGTIDLFQKRFAKSDRIAHLKRLLSSEEMRIRGTLVSSSWAFMTALMSRLQPDPILVILPGLKAQESFYQDLQTWLAWLSDDENAQKKDPKKGLTTCFFSAWETLHSHPSRAEITSERLQTLLALSGFEKSPESTIIVANGIAMLQKTFAPSDFQKRTKALSVGANLDPRDLVKWLQTQTYEPESKVTQKGEFASRGGIVDVFVPAHAWPIRIEFFGNAIDSIRHFDPQTQLSFGKMDFVMLSPAEELAILQKASAGSAASLLEYLPESSLLILCESEANEELANQYRSQVSNELSDNAFSEKILLQNWADWMHRARSAGLRIFEWSCQDPMIRNADASASNREIAFSGFEEHQPYRPIEMRAEAMPVMEQRREQFFVQLHRWLRQGYRVDVFCNNQGEQDRFAEIWEDRFGAGESFSGALQIQIGMLEKGFLICEEKWAVISDAEIFGRYKMHRPRRLKSSRASAIQSALEIDFADWIRGDYVVHLQHGIGRFVGLQTIETSGAECLVIEYATKAFQETPPKLYVPVTEAHLVSKYVGAGKANPPLDALGGARWTKAKARAKDAIVDLAGEMLAIAAARESQTGHAFSADTHWQHEFESAFLYEETPDQKEAITQTKGDMESGKPMDRLICGDVGFGKTEVAIRAAFKAVMSGKQVALLVPTTVLAQQHFNNWAERMRDYPIRLELLSRFQKPRAAADLIRAIAKGAIDIVIGTHRLLGKDVHFKDLGLVIIDEEQRFGVIHKDKFKLLRRLVDVLTLSATPIPRTLHMALIGARDMSTIQTPPQDRLPVQTIVAAYDERIIRDAIQRELRRQGQVYFLHNRVVTIEKIAEKIRLLVPTARVLVGHGQMDAKCLEETMTQFVNGDADVLVSTTIIESGLDIPNANTILIDRADRFGLSDLYQLRGRVGRYKHQAYAYLFVPRKAGLLSDARQRLAAMKQYSRLGSGFQIAMRDLEIRGAGNMLGPQQSGHITAVGFELYCQLLKQSIATLKGERADPRIDVHVKFDFLSLNPEEETSPITNHNRNDQNDSNNRNDSNDSSDRNDRNDRNDLRHRAAIPYGYVREMRGRIEIYRKLAQANHPASLRALRRELRDRYGPIPEAVERLLLVADIKWIASTRNISSIETRSNKLMLTRNRDWVMIGSRFPRLTKKQPEARLKEVKRLLKSL